MSSDQNPSESKTSPHLIEFLKHTKKFSDLKPDGIWIRGITGSRIAELKEEIKKVIFQSYLLDENQYELCAEKKEVFSDIERKFQVKGSRYQLPIVGDIPVVFQVNPLTSISCVEISDPESIPVDSLISVDWETPQSTSNYVTIEMSKIDNYTILKKESWNLPMNHHITLVVPDIKGNASYSWNLLFEKCLKNVLDNDMFPHTIGISIPTEISEHLEEFCQDILTAAKKLLLHYQRPHYILLFVKTSKMMRKVIEILKTPLAANSDLQFSRESEKFPLVAGSAQQEGCTVKVINGLITEQKVDVVVSSTDMELTLTNGKVSKALLDKAGQDLQRECKRNYPKGIFSQKIVIIKGYNLPCKFVFFGNLPSSKGMPGHQPNKNITIFVENCFKKATESNLSSIAFPALGTGRLGYEPKDAASQMASAIVNLKFNTPESSLKEIIIVIYPNTKGMDDFFELNNVFAKDQDSYRAVPNRKPESPQQNEQKQTMPSSYNQLQWIPFFYDANRKETWDGAIRELSRKLSISATPNELSQNKQIRQKNIAQSETKSPYLEPENRGYRSHYSDPFDTNKQESPEFHKENTRTPFSHEPERTRAFLSNSQKNEDINCFQTENGLLVKVYQGNILKVDVDGIVNAANKWLAHSGGVARAIINAAGDTVNREGKSKLKGRTLDDGEVLSTSAGNLQRYKNIIHAVGPMYSSVKSDDYYRGKVAETVYNSLEEANKLSLSSVALPAISSAIFGVPLHVCTAGYFLGVKKFSRANAPNCPLKEVHFVDMNSNTSKAIKDYFAKQMNEAPLETNWNNTQQTEANALNYPNLGQFYGANTNFDHVQEAKNTASFETNWNNTQQPKYNNLNLPNQEKHENMEVDEPIDIHEKHPGGTMDIMERTISLLGVSTSNTFYEIKYFIPSTHQKGQLVKETSQLAYLPVTEEGKIILKMLQLAFERYLIFRVKENVGYITWSDIPHKTNLYGDKDDCMDPDYLNEVKEKLAEKGITPEDVAGRSLQKSIVLE